MTDLRSGSITRETLEAGTAPLQVATIAREMLRSTTTAATQLQTGSVTRETLEAGTAPLRIGAIARETLISSKSGRRRYVLVY